MYEEKPLETEEETLEANENGRVFHMWEPLSFTTPQGYDYLHDGKVFRIGTNIFRFIVKGILTVLDKALFGIEYEGKENIDALSGGAVTVCNHIHQMDCTFVDHILGLRRIYFITIEENFRIPVIRHIVLWLGGVPLPKSMHGMKELFDSMGTALRRGDIVQIYPEGIMYPYHKGLRQFQSGAFHLSCDNDVPVLPMVITQHKPRGIFRIFKRKPTLKLTVLPAIYPDTTLPKRRRVEQLQKQCREAMEKKLSE